MPHGSHKIKRIQTHRQNVKKISTNVHENHGEKGQTGIEVKKSELFRLINNIYSTNCVCTRRISTINIPLLILEA